MLSYNAFSSCHGRVKVSTTRPKERRTPTSLPPIEVGSMEVSEAVELFSTYSDYDRAVNHAKIEMIVQELGCLALAVTLAGSYMLETHLELDEYLV